MKLIKEGATLPQNAPNYRQIPADKDRGVILDGKGNVQILTPTQLSTGNFVPQNFSIKPYNLKNFPAAPTSLDRAGGG